MNSGPAGVAARRHLFAITPDLLFAAGIAHRRWMDIFLGHVGSHFVPGRNLTWYVVFLASLAAYLVASEGSTWRDRERVAGHE